MKKSPTYRTCKKCKWVHFAVTRKAAELEVKKFNEYYNTLTPEQQQDFYGGKPSNIRFYERCGLCGTCNHNFRRSKKGDCPNGSTVNPIIWDKK